ncbi:hypothetical protein LEP1GSC188_2797 [Leptospira weilii serovar Topaz str. LT2116]|uniref:Uncharacterized protein n=1 Tax=Leptospira weilii serovar Topaz str. LT2116 TaxID=1088540 RepID=M3G9W2_9LEPT|nr:hypothetical protein LEP1GSC188_2797 [Leptospira weilii serovar Topaz str. LT2116]
MLSFFVSAKKEIDIFLKIQIECLLFSAYGLSQNVETIAAIRGDSDKIEWF